MILATDSGSYLRRSGDLPLLVVSQDYELFFGNSGSIEKCLFEPTDMLLDFADESGIRITFFVDSGMLCRMQQLSSSHPAMAKDLSRVKRHIQSLQVRGHDVGLHIHPHWEDTNWSGGAWNFTGSRYQLRDFSRQEVGDIVSRYTRVLNDLCDRPVDSFRAGGFCVEPFDCLRKPLLDNGITIDSSVVPGARLADPDKGFDFTRAPQEPFWRFDDSPLQACANGRFLEVPVTTVVLPVYHYWARALDRLLGRQPTGVIGDGSSKALGKTEILRRLAGAGRTSELSLDTAKAGRLLSRSVGRQNRRLWQVMGHPKLLGKVSLETMRRFIERKEVKRFETLSSLASAIRAGDVFAAQE